MAGTKFYHFKHNGSFYCPASLDEAISLLKEDGFVWFNFYKPSREELNSLVDATGFHPLSVEDCFDEKQIPKLEHFQTNSFMIFNSFIYQNGELFVDEVDFVLGEKFLITVSGYHSENREPLNNVALMAEKAKPSLRERPDSLMHIVLDYLVDEKYKAFDIMEDELELAEDILLNEFGKFIPGKLLEIRKNLMRLRKSLFHEREILVKIVRMDCPFILKKTVVHYRDVYDHLEKFFELTDTYRETVTSLMELYTSLLNNLMTKMSNETNNSVKRLTLIATIFMPLTLVASIFGMS
ncbi:MAG TPA: magnesium transporter CorA family protein, partial [Bacteroidales bacterium]|nr:magnesium transporter CorA family protein [Bacteroidales bacterium]